MKKPKIVRVTDSEGNKYKRVSKGTYVTKLADGSTLVANVWTKRERSTSKPEYRRGT